MLAKPERPLVLAICYQIYSKVFDIINHLKYVNSADIFSCKILFRMTETDTEIEKKPITDPMRNVQGYRFDIVERLFFAYRDFTRDPDLVLADYGFGRAHHRVLYFVNRTPGIRVADLLEILNITKQSLARVLKQLMETGFIVQKPSPYDGRERFLYPTEEGRNLALDLSGPQCRRIEAALEELGPAGADAAKKFLTLLINENDLNKVEKLEQN